MIPAPEKRIAEFEKRAFGMFIHWGLYSSLRQGEWTLNIHKIPSDEYRKCFDNFTACDFDAKKIVALAKKAGMKYITLTTRHHDGFSLYDTRGLSDYDVMHCPCQRDLIKEFVDACNEEDILPVFYHTTLDWVHPDFDADFDAYLEYLRKSVEILCTHYGKIGGLWFDGNWSKRDADWKLDELYGMIHRLQPDAMVINNTGLSQQGKTGHPEIDSVTFEQGVPSPMDREGMPKYIAAEMCHTVNDHWGIGKYDINYKSPAHLIECLCNCRKVGANYLLNIGPEAQGNVNSYQQELFKLIGIWMETYGEAIYNGRPYPSTGMGKNFILKSVNEDCLYIFSFDLGSIGDENVIITGKYSGAYAFGNVKEEIKSIHWMDNDKELDFIQGKDMLCVDLSGYEYGKSLGVRVAKAYLK